jgi:hypothetical protein
MNKVEELKRLEEMHASLTTMIGTCERTIESLRECQYEVERQILNLEAPTEELQFEEYHLGQDDESERGEWIETDFGDGDRW